MSIQSSTRIVCAVAVASVLVMASTASAADYVWVGGDWGSTSSWTVDGLTPATTPGAADNIVGNTGSGTASIGNDPVTINNWTFNSSSTWESYFSATVPTPFTITGELNKSGTGVLKLRGSGSKVFMDLSIGTLSVSDGALNLGTSYELHSFSAGSANLSGGTTTIHAGSNADNQAGTTFATVADLTMSGSSILQIRNQYSTASTIYGRLEVGSLNSTDTTPTVRVNEFTGSGSANHAHGTLILNNPTGTSADFAGKFFGVDARNILAVVKNGAGTQVLSGNANSYNDGTTINAGALLLNNTSGSGTGTGAILVNAGGTIGGSGRVAPTGTNAISIAGTIAPGAAAGAIGELEINLSSTTGTITLASGGALNIDLSAAGLTIATPGISDLLGITGASAGAVEFNNNTIAVQGGGVGWYKLLDTDGGGATWSGLTLSGQTITGGLSLAGGYGGTLLMGDGINGDVGDIYLNVTAVPEPAALSLLGLAGLALMRRRRRS